MTYPATYAWLAASRGPTKGSSKSSRNFNANVGKKQEKEFIARTGLSDAGDYTNIAKEVKK